MADMYDVVIIGGGPAGLATAIYGARSRLKTVILEKGQPGGQVATTEELENYPGFSRGTTGQALIQAMVDHALSFGAEIHQAEVIGLRLDDTVKQVVTKQNGAYLAKSVVLALGSEPRSLNIPGEQKLRGRGVSYCATCDADFFAGLDVVVVGNGDAAIEEAIYLTKFAQSVTIIATVDDGNLRCNRTSTEKALANEKIKWVWNSVLAEIVGDEVVEKVVVKDIKSGKLAELETNGVFFFVGTVPKTALVKGSVLLSEEEYIITDENMETSVPGVFAAGDARVKTLRQVVTAANDGAIAAVNAEKYITEEEEFSQNVLQSEKPAMVVFWSRLNEDSVKAASLLEKRYAADPDVKLVQINYNRNKRYAHRYGITEIPAVLVFEKGEVVQKFSAAEIAQGDVKLA